MVALEQHVVDNNVSSSAVIYYISTANKVDFWDTLFSMLVVLFLG
jgi:hypothetical protein